MGKKISELPAAAAFDGTELLELVQAGANVRGLLGALLPPGYVDGLKLQWVSGNALTVTSGAAYVPSLGRVLRVPNAIAKTGLALTASTWYHVYLWLNGTNADIEIVATASSAIYNGTARTKAGDTSRRYLGSVLTDGTGKIWPFTQSGPRVSYYWNNLGNAPMRPLSVGAAITGTVVPLASSCPVTATHVNLRAQNGDPSVAARLSNKDFAGAVGDSGGGTYAILPCAPSSNTVLDFPLANDQSLVYWMTSAPTSGLTLDVFGYLYER
jgi:hypothetical protein